MKNLRLKLNFKKIVNELNLKAKVMNIDANLVKIDVNYITCRVFKKITLHIEYFT